MEYEEQFGLFWGAEIAHNLLGRLITAENISLHSVFYNFHLITGDQDDNKFADIYLAARADILVTNDKLLLALGKKDYPPVKVMTLQEFAKYIQE